MRDAKLINDAPFSAMSDSVKSSIEGTTAIAVISRSAGEGSDMPSNRSDGHDGSYLSLSENELSVLDGLTQLKKQGKVNKIIVILNTSATIQLDFLDGLTTAKGSTYDIDVDACLWVGNVGSAGIRAVAGALVGQYVPSGKLTDTYAKDNFASPAAMQLLYNNVGKKTAKRFAQSYEGYQNAGLKESNMYYGVYSEGIYVGYRYFETRYYDSVIGRENTGDYNYDDDVAYSFGYGLSYVAYFPQLVADPIEAPGDFMPQLKAEHSFNRDDMAAGFRLLLCGFFRKCVVADLCGIYVNCVFADIHAANTLAVAGAGALFCIQMYCDFAGYSEIAAGCARMLGVRLTCNFNRPYLSQSYTEFFRRWHISLNRWFTQYVYIPLGGNRRGQIVKMRNTVIVFALCGLWHGANWIYVLWGLYAAFFVCLESFLLPLLNQAAEKYGINLENPMIVLCRRLLMFFIFIPAALLFRAQSIGQVGEIITVLASGTTSVSAALDALGLNGYSLMTLLLIIVTMNRLHVWSVFDLPAAANASVTARRDAGMVLMTLAVILSWLALLATQNAAGFAYFQF